MASLLDSLGQFATPDMIAQAGKMLGIDDATMKQGLDVAGPLLLGATSRKAATPEGAQVLLEGLSRPGETNLLDQITKGDIGGALGSLMSANPLGNTAGDGIVNNLMGQGQTAVAQFVQDKYGFDIKPVLALAAPFVTGLVAQQVKTNNLDANGLTSLLKSESETFAAGNSELAGVISGALDAGEKVVAEAEALKGRFTPTEWQSLLDAPVLAAGAVMFASPSGPIGMTQELMAMSKVMIDGAKGATPGSLLDTVGTTLRERSEKVLNGAQPDDLKALLDTSAKGGALDGVRQAATLVSEKDAAGAASYKQFLYDIAHTTAKAAREGGFLGIGSKEISEKEQAVLNDLAATLGVSA
jgi:hypothetical protein